MSPSERVEELKERLLTVLLVDQVACGARGEGASCRDAESWAAGGVEPLVARNEGDHGMENKQ